MTTLIYPAPEACPDGWDNMPVNIEHVRTLRKTTVLAVDEPGIQFLLVPGTSVEWAFLTEADRDHAWTHIMTCWGEPIG